MTEIKRKPLPSEIKELNKKAILTDSSSGLMGYKDCDIIINGERKKIIKVENDTTLRLK